MDHEVCKRPVNRSKGDKVTTQMGLLTVLHLGRVTLSLYMFVNTQR